MKYVSNRRLCGGKTSKNIGFYYKVTFYVGQDDMKYAFKLPNDFGHGGVSMMDGKTMKIYKKDIWAGGKSTVLDFSVTLNTGMHTLEVYGAEGCCDGTARWYFNVNGGKWLDFTVGNLDRQVVNKDSMCCFRNFSFYDDQKCGCQKSEHQCANGECVPKTGVCDGKPNCADKSDEGDEQCCFKKFSFYNDQRCGCTDQQY
jgi:hypothetical protein